jgi:hypothetical protein
MQAFSKIDLPDTPVRNPLACATYMLWGIYPPDMIESLPDAALADLWSLSQSRARLVRSGGSFAKFRRSVAADPTTAEERANQARIKANRAETTDPRPRRECRDRLLAKIIIKRGSAVVPALLFEEAPNAVANAVLMEEAPERDSSSATSTVTQEATEGTCSASTEVEPVPRAADAANPDKATLRHQSWSRARNIIWEGFAAVWTRILATTATLHDWLVRFTLGDGPPE